MLNARGEVGGAIYADEPATVRVHYTAYSDIGRANATLRIIRSDGLSCVNLRTHEDRFALDIHKGPGEYSVTLDPVQLYAGVYYARSWVMNADDSVGMAGGESSWFEVSARAAGREGGAAVFEPNREWSAAAASVSSPPARTLESRTSSRRAS